MQQALNIVVEKAKYSTIHTNTPVENEVDKIISGRLM